MYLVGLIAVVHVARVIRVVCVVSVIDVFHGHKYVFTTFIAENLYGSRLD